MGEENPDWRGDYAVSYRASEGQAIVFQYVDNILASGFDGVYLDKIDEFEYWEENG